MTKASLTYLQTAEVVRVNTLTRRHSYDIAIGTGELSALGPRLRHAVGESARRVVVVTNRRVNSLLGDVAQRSLTVSGFETSSVLIGDGERFKSMETLDRILGGLASQGIERSDVIVALGGGVVGDLAGFAAATYLRGIRFVNAPTTLLAQIDSSVGGKTGVNLSHGKNLVGSFHQPILVVIDPLTLATLPTREVTAGLCEAVKQGAVAGSRLFGLTCAALSDRDHDDWFARPLFTAMIAAQCSFKASIVAGDERESTTREDHRSRRILNFGHTVAHALEQATGYRALKHGEAVGYGMQVAGELSKSLGMLKQSELELLRDAIGRCGRLPRLKELNEQRVLSAISRDKKSVGGAIKWVLLERIGRARIVDSTEIAPEVVIASLRSVFQ